MGTYSTPIVIELLYCTEQMEREMSTDYTAAAVDAIQNSLPHDCKDSRIIPGRGSASHIIRIEPPRKLTDDEKRQIRIALLSPTIGKAFFPDYPNGF